jgi:hypothetical protein
VRTVKLTMTLPEATHVHLVLSSLTSSDELRERVGPERSRVYANAAGALEAELVRAGCRLTPEGWEYPRA